MRFNKIVIPEKITQEKGIEPINIRRLSSVIAFIGKNGSGKTRILDLIEKNPFLIDTELSNIPNDISTGYYTIQKRKELEDLESKVQKNIYDMEKQKKIDSLLMYLQNSDMSATILSNISNQITKKYIRRIKQEELSLL